MRILITGGSGFVGRYMTDECMQAGHDVIVLSMDGASMETPAGRNVPTIGLDIRDAETLQSVVHKAKPDAICHLAGMAHVVNSGKNPVLLNDVTLRGLLSLCQSALTLNRPIPVLIASSAFVYGDEFNGPVKVSESTRIQPTTPYGFVKFASECLLQSFTGTSITGYIARPFNHIGPGQDSSFVCSAFAKRIKEATGDYFETGNLAARRDFSDVRDIVRAYRLILEKRPKSNVFVLGRGQTVKIGDIVETMISISGKRLQTRVNPDFLRSNDNADIAADTTLAQKELGWSCEIPLKQTLSDIMNSK